MAKISISLDDMKHLEQISMIKLTDAEEQKFMPQLEIILNYVEKLSEVDTTGTKETSQVTGLTNILRVDVVLPSLTQEAALSNAPEKEKGYFKMRGKLKIGDQS